MAKTYLSPQMNMPNTTAFAIRLQKCSLTLYKAIPMRVMPSYPSREMWKDYVMLIRTRSRKPITCLSCQAKILMGMISLKISRMHGEARTSLKTCSKEAFPQKSMLKLLPLYMTQCLNLMKHTRNYIKT